VKRPTRTERMMGMTIKNMGAPKAKIRRKLTEKVAIPARTPGSLSDI